MQWPLHLVAMMGRKCKDSSRFRRIVITSVLLFGVYVLLSASLGHKRYLRDTITYHINLTPSVYFHKGIYVTKEAIPTKRERKPVSPRVLLLYSKPSVSTAKEIRVLLQSHRILYDMYSFNSTTQGVSFVRPSGTKGAVVGRYSIIILADAPTLYNVWSLLHIQQFLNYSREFNVTLLYFFPPTQDHAHVSMITIDHAHSPTTNFSTSNFNTSSIKGIHLNPSKDFYYLKTDEEIKPIPNNTLWNVINVTSFQGVEILAKVRYSSSQSDDATMPLAIVADDIIRRVVIGSSISFWMTKLLLLEVMRLFSPHPLARFGRERWLMIDIDDIFVAPHGLKMTPADVEALITSQDILRQFVPGLTFNLGFCGYFYDRGTELEINGSQSLVLNRDKFWWFGHTYKHYQPHTMTQGQLMDHVSLNYEFATNFSIPSAMNSYSVSPHHSGVYPIYPPLYNAWSQVLNVTMTTTEEYPHLYPPHRRRGFIHQGVMVLPRQTCRLFTHNYYYKGFVNKPKEGMGVASRGKAGLRAVAEGGEVFDALLNAPVSIFMTHMTNYAKDRLAPFLFQTLFQFVTRWTKLELQTEHPLNLGKKYFNLFPEDKLPLWTSPCSDKRHMEIWGQGKNCTRLPSVVILGPQKTGTTALHLFLKAHPNISANHQTKDHFEEVQFFSNATLYDRGIDWYMEQFPFPSAETQMLFEKSATYFTHFKAPERISALIPTAKLIVILHDPVRRAHSWYQHMRAHGDKTALNFSFMSIIKSNGSSPRGVQLLRQRCLEPGRYHVHLNNWLRYFHPSQLFLVDGQLLVTQPQIVMESLQKFLQVDTLDYLRVLKYNSRKQHFCVSGKNRMNCLGPSKGRHYPLLRSSDWTYLRHLYRLDNLKLATLLRRLKQPFPIWLKQHLSYPFTKHFTS